MYTLTTDEMNTALEAVAYFAKAGRLNNLRDTLETLAELERGIGTLRGLHAIQFLIQDWAEVKAGTLS
jgi:hypothetical protein